MKYYKVSTRFVLLIGLFMLAFSFVSPAQAAKEIWVPPGPGAKKPFGNWATSPLKKKISFSWSVPADYDSTQLGNGKAFIVLFSLKDQDVSYELQANVIQNGDPFDLGTIFTSNTKMGLVKGELVEIDVSNVLPATLVPSDYITMNFKRVGKAKVVVVGLRFVYNPVSSMSLNGTTLQLNNNAGTTSVNLLSIAPWRFTGTDIFFGNNVGIGTNSPAQPLDVVGNATVSGEVRGGNFITTSDRRRKKNIEALGNTLDKVMALKPARYHFKTEDDSGSKHFGLIAQDLKEVFPEVVRVNPEGEEFGPGEAGLHTVAYSELIPVLIKSIQEQQMIIQEQKATNEKQQALIRDVQAQLERHQEQQVAFQELEGKIRKMKMQLDHLEQAGWTLAENQ
ncbi:MAG: tail fiber domain-containing protein [Nitrospinota bacterium]|nr:tail fiber domain-containing protein [Nitrospinota bacterium]